MRSRSVTSWGCWDSNACVSASMARDKHNAADSVEVGYTCLSAPLHYLAHVKSQIYSPWIRTTSLRCPARTDSSRSLNGEIAHGLVCRATRGMEPHIVALRARHATPLSKICCGPIGTGGDQPVALASNQPHEQCWPLQDQQDNRGYIRRQRLRESLRNSVPSSGVPRGQWSSHATGLFARVIKSSD